MIDSIYGTIVDKTPSNLVIDLHGIRLSLAITVSTYERLPDKGHKAELLTYLHVREDLLQLYGFDNEEQRKLFMLLIGVSGIGPRSAMSIMSGASTEEFKNRIVSDDVKALTVIPGIGTKTAKRIIVELKEKFIKVDTDIIPDLATTELEGSKIKDVINALASLGYSRSAVNRALTQLKNKGELDGSLEEIIKNALRAM